MPVNRQNILMHPGFPGASTLIIEQAAHVLLLAGYKLFPDEKVTNQLHFVT